MVVYQKKKNMVVHAYVQVYHGWYTCTYHGTILVPWYSSTGTYTCTYHVHVYHGTRVPGYTRVYVLEYRRIFEFLSTVHVYRYVPMWYCHTRVHGTRVYVRTTYVHVYTRVRTYLKCMSQLSDWKRAHMYQCFSHP
jgi:hypothetical protein